MIENKSELILNWVRTYGSDSLRLAQEEGLDYLGHFIDEYIQCWQP